MPASADFAPVSPSAPLPAFAERFGRVDKKVRAALENLGLRAVGDLLAHYPRRHEDRTRFDRFPNQPTGQPLCLRGEITDVQTRFMPGRRRFCEAVVEDPGGGALSGRIVLRWFNMPFIHKLLAVGQEIVLYGEPKQKGKRLVIDHPDYEIVERAGELAGIHLDRIVPVYPATAGLNQRTLRALVFRALEAITDDDLPDRLPAGAGQSEGGAHLSRARAVRAIHFPEDFDTLAQARRYLALEEFARLQLELLERRSALDAAGGESRCGSGEILARFLESLPFEPTGAQRHCIDEIRRDLAAPRPMSRLLQGDVGSGKTLVAAAAMVLAAEAGFDAALMAPTQILAEQHFRNFRGWLEPLGVPVRLRTGAKQTDGGDLPLFDLALSGEKPTGSVTIGTHALVSGDSEEFENGLGLVVIDEQHKFGVAQRQALIARGDRPDVLVMTATPIPRTLTLAFYGDLDVSILDEMPKGRGRLVTGIRDASKTEAATAFVREHLERGRQAYIVYPLIEESEKVKSAAAATAEFSAWEARFAGFRCGLLHGKLSGGEKDRVMEAFRGGEIDVLVATTVIEVGVDVSNANLMLVFGADRFGLAQLHQLRGRIGRGEHKSYCVLMIDTEDAGAAERLRILEETRDGFRIAEADLEQRGPGEVLGTAQSGMPDLKFASLLGDLSLVREARAIAEKMLGESDRTQQG